MFRFPVGQAYLWRDDDGLTLVDAGDLNAAAPIEGRSAGSGSTRPRSAAS